MSYDQNIIHYYSKVRKYFLKLICSYYNNWTTALFSHARRYTLLNMLTLVILSQLKFKLKQLICHYKYFEFFCSFPAHNIRLNNKPIVKWIILHRISIPFLWQFKHLRTQPDWSVSLVLDRWGCAIHLWKLDRRHVRLAKA